MSKVLFTHSYFYQLDPKQWNFKQPYPPLGTIQAAAVAREEGFNVGLFDVALRGGPEEIYTILLGQKPTYLVIYDDGFNYLTKMCLTIMREAAFSMISLAKQAGCIVIVNSSDATDQYDKYLEKGADYIIRGEGEETLRELLHALENKSDLNSITGLAFFEGGRSKVTAPRKVMRDLDQLPMPAWDLIDIDSYRTIWMKHHGYFSLNIATTRGCPYKCNWCAKPIYGNRYNTRSPQQVVNEIDLLLGKHKPDHIWMCDDIFGLKPGWMKDFSLLVKERGLSFRYKIQSRADLLIDEDAVQLLAESGCETVWMGAESGSQAILDAMDKGITLAQIEASRLLLKQYEIRTAFFLQFGYLGETRNDVDATLKMVLNLMPDEIGISVSYPLPGTKFYDKVRDELKEKQNWSDSDDLALMYHGTFSPAYYKILHRYIHSRYRIKRGWQQIKSWNWLPLRTIVSMVYHLPLSFVQFYKLHRLSNVVR